MHLSAILREQIQMAKDKVQALSLRHGVSSLPDDILSEVPAYATRRDVLEEGYADGYRRRNEEHLRCLVPLASVLEVSVRLS